jgi:hypothetical protein
MTTNKFLKEIDKIKFSLYYAVQDNLLTEYEFSAIITQILLAGHYHTSGQIDRLEYELDKITRKLYIVTS